MKTIIFQGQRSALLEGKVQDKEDSKQVKTAG